MLKRACALITFAATALLFAATASAVSVQEMTAALDRAQSQDEYARQARSIEDLLKQSPAQPPEVLAQLSRAWYLMGESEKDKRKKLAYARRSIEAADRALKADPGETHAAYWRSMALLQEADASGGLTGLKDVKAALKGLEEVSTKEPGYDFAGAYRSRGKVLIEAPSWAFIGDKKKGLELLKKASGLSPGFLVNRLYLAQAYKANGMPERARAELEYILKAPLGDNPQDDRETKEEAKKLLGSL